MNISVPVVELIQAVAEAVENVRVDTKAELAVNAIDLELELGLEQSSGGVFSLGFLTIGGTYDRSQTQSLALHFESSDIRSFTARKVQIDRDLLQSLTVAIQVAVTEGQVNLPGFKLTQSTVTFAFGVGKDGRIGLGWSGEQPSSSIEFKLAGSAKTTHSMALTMISSSAPGVRSVHASKGIQNESAASTKSRAKTK